MAKRRRIEKSIEIEADAATVWKALTDGEELKRWFPLDARVTPGEGGNLWLSFGEGSDWEAPIEIWKPNEHLRTVDTAPGKDGAPPLKIAVDYIIESRGGTTTLRLVHSGFAEDAWDDELDSLDAGWMSFLENLKLYLERHRGEPRQMAFFRHPSIEVGREEAFHRTLKALGFSDPSTLRVGERYDVTTAAGDRLVGEVRVFSPPINFTGTVGNHSDAFLMVEMESGRKRCRPSIWLSFYGDARHEAPHFSERLRSLLEDAFASLAKADGS